MAVELIDKIKPKNSGSFPLVDAADVLMTDGKRLSEVSLEKGDKGDPGEKGADGTSVTITKIVESDVSGGTNTVTFSDGSVLNVKNGAKGEKGEKGDTGDGDGGSGGGTMAVTFSDVTFNDDMTGSGTASHTTTEIKAAHEGGQYVYAEFDMGDGVPYYVPLMAVVPDDTGWIAVFALALGGEVLHIMVADSKEALFQMISAETGGSGETEIFPVNFTVDSTNMTATCDVPFNDINSAVEDGKFVYGTFTYMGFPVRIPFVYIGVGNNNQAFALFEGTYELMSLKIILLVNANDTVEAQVIPITSDDTEDSDVPPTSVDLSALDTTGEIVETYADGTVKTTTIEYDDDGNPVKITDGDGNVTVLVW